MLHIFFLRYFVPGCALVPIVAGVLKFKSLSRPSKIALGYVIADELSNVISSMTSTKGNNNHFLIHVYTAIEFVLISVFFTSVFNSKKLLILIKVMAVVFILLSIVNSTFFQNLKDFNAYTLSLEALTFIAYSFLYFDQESRVRQTVSWQTKPVNWLVTGILLYFAACFFFFLFLNIISIHLSIPVQLMMWDMHGFFLMVMYFLFAVGFLNERRIR